MPTFARLALAGVLLSASTVARAAAPCLEEKNGACVTCAFEAAAGATSPLVFSCPDMPLDGGVEVWLDGDGVLAPAGSCAGDPLTRVRLELHGKSPKDALLASYDETLRDAHHRFHLEANVAPQDGKSEVSFEVRTDGGRCLSGAEPQGAPVTLAGTKLFVHAKTNGLLHTDLHPGELLGATVLEKLETANRELASGEFQAFVEKLKAGELSSDQVADGLEKLANAVEEDLPDVALRNRTYFPRVFEFLGELRTVAKAIRERHEARFKADAAERVPLARLVDAFREALAKGLEEGLRKVNESVSAPPMLVVSGGVSMGSYQAGFLYYYTRYQQAAHDYWAAVPESVREALAKRGFEVPSQPSRGFEIISGASAGTVNSFVAALQGCFPAAKNPDDSLFFRIWNSISLDHLYEKGKGGATHGFSSEALASALKAIETTIEDPNTKWTGCDFLFGTTTTRLAPRNVSVAPGSKVEVARFTEKLLLDAKAAPREAPAFFNYRHGEADPDLWPLLGVDDPAKAVPAKDVFGIVRASGAFPLAFPPIEPGKNDDPMIYYRHGTDWVADTSTPLVDGGVFNNNPVDLAVKLADWSGKNRPGQRAPARLLYLDYDEVDWGVPTSAKASTRSLVDAYTPFVENFLGAATSEQLMMSLESADGLRGRIDVPRRHSPVTGEYLLSMTAFMDEDFRRFDFTRGMVDAQRFLEDESPTFRMMMADPTRPPFEVQSERFACALAQERAYLAGPEKADPSSIASCTTLAAKEPGFVELLTATWKLRQLAGQGRFQDKVKFDLFVQALADAHFRFRSGPLAGQPGSALRGKLREYGQGAVDEIVDHTPADAGAKVVAVVGKTALDMALEYRAPAGYSVVGLNGGGIEYSHAWTFGAWALRGGATLGVGEAPWSVKNELWYAAKLTPQLTFLTDRALAGPLRWEAGLGVGALVGAGFSGGAYVRVPVSAYGAIVVADVLEFTLRPRFFPMGGELGTPLFLALPDGSTQLPHSAWDVLLGLGYRF